MPKIILKKTIKLPKDETVIKSETNKKVTKKITKKAIPKTTSKTTHITNSIENSIENSFININNIILKHKHLEKYIPLVNNKRVSPKVWELPNRKHFYNWLSDEFSQYEETNTNIQSKPETPRIENQVTLNNIQRLTRDYLQGESPVKGLLLYIGLGHGKTCAAITIAEAILTKKDVIVISKTNLENNFRKEIRKCGSDYFKIINHWVFSKCDNVGELALAKELGITTKSIIENGGAFFIDFTNNKSNYDDLTMTNRNKLDNQINHMVNKKFTFLHSDGRFLNKVKDGDFDNKVIIVDEIHNIGNTMNTKSISAAKYYKLFMEAQNTKYIFLSGTPIINQIIEISKIYNILRGYMNVLEIKFKTLYDIGQNIDYNNIKYILKKNEHIDQIIIDKTRKLIKITKNPDNFITDVKGKGIVYKPESTINFNEFRDMIVKTIQVMGYKISIEERKETCFPEDKDEFERKFYNPELNKLKNIDLIKRRIVGLTSYFGYQDKNLYPELLPINTVSVPMSLYQLSKYEKYRHEEIQDDKNKKRKDDKDSNVSSSYRIYSRFACSYVFPDEIGSPYDNKEFKDKILQVETLSEHLEDFTLSPEEMDAMSKDTLKKSISGAYLKLLEKDKHKYLDMKNGSLDKYSPKYKQMITNIQKENGKIFVYSNFVTLTGLNTFAFSLIQTGMWAPFNIKKEKINGEWKWKLDENEN